MNRRLGLIFGALVFAAAAGVNAHNYVSAERCESCHQFAFEKWQRGPHADAHLVLSEAERKDPKCTTCHSMVAVADGDPRYVGIQCESCHGPGRYYYPNYVMRDAKLARAVGLVDQSEAICVRCHTAAVPSLESFDFDTAWSRIDHGKAARENWEKRAGAGETSQKAASPNPTRRVAER